MYARTSCVPRGGTRIGNWYELVEIVGYEVVIDAIEVPADGVLDHGVISRDDEGRILQEKEESYGFKSRDGRLGQTAIKIVDEHDERDLHRAERFLETLPKGVYLPWRRGFLLGRKKSRRCFLCFTCDFFRLAQGFRSHVSAEQLLP
jgi:hypothetical protein